MFTSVSAVADVSNFQAHLRAGMVNGSFSGIASGAFNVATSTEGEAEYLYSSHMSFFSAATVALEPSTGAFRYTYMGIGQKFYFWSRSGRLNSNEDGVYVEIQPKWRYFANYSLGLSQIQVQEVTSTLTVQSTVLEYGAGAGMIYQFTKDVGIELVLNVSKGVAMSSVAVDSTIMRALLGVAISF
jgi:hypothetical protein